MRRAGSGVADGSESVHGRHRAENLLILSRLAEPGAEVENALAAMDLDRRNFDWTFVRNRILSHGIGALFLSRCEAGTTALPAELQEFLAREVVEPARCIGKEFQFTIFRFLREANRVELPTILLKGSALVGTVYRTPELRPMCDIDVLVPRDRLDLAIRVAERVGLALPPDHLPLRFFRLIHFHVQLEPQLRGLRPLETHWQLHSGADLYAVAEDELWTRRVRTEVYGWPTAYLDRLDQWLHLTTHLFRHWNQDPRKVSPAGLFALLEADVAPIALKWIADLVPLTAGLASSTGADAVARRAREWAAEPEAAAMLELLTPLLGRDSRKTLEPVRRHLRGDLRPERAYDGPWIGGWERRMSKVPRGLGFRLSRLKGLGRWIFPSARYIRAGACRNAEVGGIRLTLLRASHVARVVGRVTAATAFGATASIRRRLSPRSRALTRRAPLWEPDRMFELADDMAAFEVAYESRFRSDS